MMPSGRAARSSPAGSGKTSSGVDGVGNLLLARLSPEDRAHLEPRLTPFEFRLGEVLQRPGEPVDSVYFVDRGLLSVVASDRNGETVETSMVGREGASGLVAACGVGVPYMTHLVQIEGAGRRAPAALCRGLFQSSAAFRDIVTRHTQHVLAETRQSAVCQAMHSAEGRCARWLLESGDRAGCGDLVPLTQEYLAAMLGVQRTTVSAVASTLQRAGLIRYSRGRIRILDHPGLERASCDCRKAVKEFRETVLALT